jgi:hypothetical protein
MKNLKLPASVLAQVPSNHLSPLQLGRSPAPQRVRPLEPPPAARLWGSHGISAENLGKSRDF